MRFSDLLRTGLGNLWQRKFRTALTVTGVVVGTMAVVVMMSLGVGLSRAQLEFLEQQGNLRQVTVYAAPQSPTGAPQGESVRGLDDLVLGELSDLPEVEQAWPTYEVSAEVFFNGSPVQIQITGQPHAMLESHQLPFSKGGIPDKGAPLALLIGDKVGEAYGYSEDGRPLEIDVTGEATFVRFSTDAAGGSEPGTTVVDPPASEGGAIPLPRKQLVPTAGVIASENDVWTQHSTSIYADRDALIRALERALPGKALPGQQAGPTGQPRGSFQHSSIVLQTADVAAAESLTTQLRDSGYEVSSDVEWMRETQKSAALIQAVLGGIGFISLLVAAIGIANTMLMSVYERTREIGIMKVLGAGLGDIRRMFLLESASLGFLGGAFGLLLSWAISALINLVVAGMMGADAGLGADTRVSIIPLWLVLGALAFSTLIGTVAGIIPAQRAMRLSALAAIRTQ